MSLEHRGSAYYGDEQIQAGQKVMDLANRGPLRSLLLLLSFPLFSSPRSSFPPFYQFYESISLSCKVSIEGARAKQELRPPARLSLPPPHPSFFFPSSFHPGGCLKFLSPVGQSVQSSLSAQGHLCLSAQPQWGPFVARPCAGAYYCFFQ